MNNDITPTYNSKMSRRIDKIKHVLDAFDTESATTHEYIAVLSSISAAILKGVDSDPKVINFVKDHLGYFEKNIPEMYFPLLLVITLRDDDISKGITTEQIQDASNKAFLNISKRYSDTLSLHARDYVIDVKFANIKMLTEALLKFTMDMKEGFPITPMEMQERHDIIRQAKEFILNSFTYMVKNNIPYLWYILSSIPIYKHVHYLVEADGDTNNKESNISKYMKYYAYSNSCKNYTKENPDCIEEQRHTSSSYKSTVEGLQSVINQDYIMNDIHSMLMLQKHFDAMSTEKPGTLETTRCQYHAGLAAVYYQITFGYDIDDMITEEYIKFVFKDGSTEKNNPNDNFVTFHNCIEHLNKHYGYSNRAMRVLKNYRNYLKLARLI